MDAGGTILTDRQVEVLQLRERGHTQTEVAEKLGTTDSNVSAIERAAEDNIEKARRTLDLVRTMRTPAQFTLSAGTDFDEVVDRVYEQGDQTGIKITYSRPELYAHLYDLLEDRASQNQLETPVTVGLTEDGEVTVFQDQGDTGRRKP
jgi:Tfx family DNA-binding protein